MLYLTQDHLEKGCDGLVMSVHSVDTLTRECFLKQDATGVELNSIKKKKKKKVVHALGGIDLTSAGQGFV